MRPVSLTLSGLHSYREAVTVDFDALGRYGLFGIFGPIGGGKSTLLDAITLALYGLVDRTATRSRRGLVHLGSDRCEVRFRFRVSPRTADGDIETWEVHRAYREEGGVAQRTASRLVRIDAGLLGETRLVVAEKELEVNAAVEQIVGLGPDDFMRAVVLPQGRFVQLLHLKGQERRQMLQRIFRLQAYGDQLRNRVRDRQAAARSQEAEVRGELAGLGDASPRAVAAATRQTDTAREARDKAEDELLAAQARHDLGAAARKSRDRWLEAVRARDAHLAEQAAIEADAARAERADRLRPLVGPARRFFTATDRTRSAEREVERCAERRAEATARAAAAEARAAGVRDRVRALDPDLRDRMARLRDAVRWEDELDASAGRIVELEEGITAASRAQVEARTSADAAKTRAAALDRDRKRVRRDLAKKRVLPDERERIQRAARAADAVDAARRLVEEARAAELAANGAVLVADQRCAEADEALEGARRAETEARAAHATALVGTLSPEALEELSRRIAEDEQDLTRRAERAGELAAAEAEAAEVRERVTRCEAALQQARAELDRATEILRGADRTLADAEQVREVARTRAAAAHLATQLGPGQPCPVCGSKHHPGPATPLEGAFEAAVEAHRAGQQRAADRHHVALAQRGAAAAASDAALAAWDVVRTRVQVATQSLLAVPDPGDALDQRRERRRQARLAEDDAAAAAKALAEAALEGQRAEAPLAAARATREAARSDHERLRVQRELRVASAGEAWAAFDRDRGELTLFDVRGALAALDQRDREAHDLASRAEELDQEREASVRAADDHRSAADRHLAAFDRATERRAELEQRRATLVAQLAEVAGGVRVQEALAAATSALERCTEELASAEEALARSRVDQAEASEAMASASSALAAAAQESADARAELLRLGTATDSDDAALATELTRALADLPEADAVEELWARVHGWRDRRVSLDARVETLDEQRGRTEPPSDEAFAALEATLADQLVRIEVARDEAIHSARTLDELVRRSTRWTELVATSERLDRDLSRLDELTHLLRGDRFVEYVANDHLIELTARASVHLAELTSRRYTLELDDELAFVVCDHELGGARRPVHGLSGGESFLTALSLALALSAQVQARSERPLGFFFLDEGFGTLDPDALDRVMTAIEALRSEERLIGLISHVPSVRDRVPRWLWVTRSAGGGSTVELKDS